MTQPPSWSAPDENQGEPPARSWPRPPASGPVRPDPGSVPAAGAGPVGVPPWGMPPPVAPHPGWAGGPVPGPSESAWSAGPPGVDPGFWAITRTPGIVPLRPLQLGDIFDGAIRAIRTNPRTMIGFSALVIAVLTVLATIPQAALLTRLFGSDLLTGAAGSDPDVQDAAETIGITALTLGVSVLQHLLTTTVLSCLLIVAVDAAVRGRSLAPGEVWRRSRGRLPAVLGLSLLVLVALPALMVLFVLPGVLLLTIGDLPTGYGAATAAVGIVLAIPCVLALYFGFWAVAAPALLLERLGVIAALRRSRRLVRRSFWRVAGIMVLTAILSSVIGQIIQVPFGLLGVIGSALAGAGGFSAVLTQLVVGNIGAIISGAVLYPFSAAVTALLYLDLRIRHEGLDVELMRMDRDG